jgi:DNA primase catalytic core
MRYDDLKEQVQEANPIEDVVAETVSLPPQRSPQGYKIHCPFHHDAQPSLHVYPQTDSWWCYGCNRGGDVFDWIQLRDKVGFREALGILVDQAGIPCPQQAPEPLAQILRRRAIEDVLALAVAFYHHTLMNTSQARQSQLDRGFTEETLRAFRVGCAHSGGLRQHLHSLGVEVALAQEAGLLWEDGRDVFTQRIIYPVISRGRVVYLTGRATTQEQVEAGKKYYHLRGLRPLFHPDALRGDGPLIIVEGPTDVLTLHQWGLRAVGLMGLGKLSDRDLAAVQSAEAVYVALDGDEAGQHRARDLAREIGPLTHVLQWPEGIQDANEFLMAGHTESDFQELLAAAPTLLDVKIAETAEKEGIKQEEHLQRLFTLLTKLSPFALARYKSLVGSELGIKAREFNRLLRAAQAAQQVQSEPPKIIEGRYQVISPALDFLDEAAWVTVPLLVQQSTRFEHKPYLVTSTRKLLPIMEEGTALELGGKSVVIREWPAALGRSPRWEYGHIQAFLHGYTPEPQEVFRIVRALYDKYLDFRDPHTADVLALWAIGTYLYPLFETYPYIALLGPKGSGKTKTISLTAKLAFNMRVTSDISPSALFRVVEATRATLGIDESERLSRGRDTLVINLRLLLNAGYKRGSPAIRIEGEDFRVREFEVYAPKILASIRGLEDVLESRCILITMLRTTTSKGNLTISEQGEDWAAVRHELYSLALTHHGPLRAIYEQDVSLRFLTNRDNELWLPLLSLAKLLEEWGVAGLLDRVKAYALASTRRAEGSTLSDWEQALLLALHELTEDCERCDLTTRVIREQMGQFVDQEELEELRAQWIGYALKRLGFTDKTRCRGGNVYHIAARDVWELMDRYGVEVPLE